MTEIEIITKYEDFAGLKNIWNELLEKSSNDIVFLRHEWFKCWWESFGAEKQFFIIIVKKNNKITGIAPLMINNINYRGLRVRELGFIQNDNSPRSDFIFASGNGEALDKIISYFKQNSAGWDIVSFKHIAEDSPTCRILPLILKENKIPFGTQITRRSPYLKTNSDWQTYISQKSSKFRRSLKNKMNRVKKLGDFKIKKFTHISNGSSVFSDIIKISGNSWKSKCNGDLARTPENKKFFENLSLTCSKHNWLNIWLFFDGTRKPVAYEYHIAYKNKTYAMRADFDEKYRYYSPGVVLEMNIIERFFKDKISEYDLCGNYYDYKMKWANKIREHKTYELFGFNVRSKLLYLLEYKVFPIARKLGLNKWVKRNAA